MSGLTDVLETVLRDEPVADGALEAVYRRAEVLRRRKIRAIVMAGAVTALAVAALGYGLATAMIPAPDPRPAGGTAVAATPVAVPDPVLSMLTEVAGDGVTVLPRGPSRGPGWRQYVAAGPDGRPRGLIEVSAYATPGGLCFPVLADPRACARPSPYGPGVQYVRYSFDTDVDFQAHQVIARRVDGRTVVVLVTGERGTGRAYAGRPALTAAEAARVAVDPAVMADFGAAERCNGPDPACPVLRVPVRTA